MRVTKDRAAQNRSRVVDIAGKLFRERGFEGVGVADIMRSAGLTHGGFYGQFESKDALVAEACTRVFEGAAARWDRLGRDNPDAALAAIAAFYLSSGHRDELGASCALSTLAVDVSRREGPIRQLFTRGLLRLLAILEPAMPDATDPERRRSALAAMASFVGAVVLSRAVDDADLSDEILAATADALGIRPPVPASPEDRGA